MLWLFPGHNRFRFNSRLGYTTEYHRPIGYSIKIALHTVEESNIIQYTSTSLKMRKSTLRQTTLLSLLGLSTQQSVSSWGEPFTVAPYSTPSTLIPGNTPTAASSQQSLLPSSNHRSGASSIHASSASPRSSTAASGSPSSAPSASSQSPTSSFTVSLPQTTQSALTVSTPLSGRASSTTVAVQSTGGAVPLRKMGLAGVMAGAAGVLVI